MIKKKVIIIEDDFNDFKKIREYLDASCDCYPKISDNDNCKFLNFISLFQISLDSGEDTRIRDKNKKQLLSCLKKHGNDVYYILDYALRQNDTENITGRKFYDTIITELYPNLYIPTIILTGINFDIEELNRISNELTRYKDEINTEAGSRVFDWRRKNFKNPEFKIDIIDFINQTQSKPRKEEQSSKRDITDFYEK